MTNDLSPRVLADRLVGACGDIETELKWRLGSDWKPRAGQKRGLGTYAHALRDRGDAQVRQYFDQILAYVSLRNAIAHSGYRNGQPIAAPFPETVEGAVKLSENLRKPPTVERYISRPVTASASEQLVGPLRTMVDNDFAQLPVFDEDKYVGMLTTNAVARWVGAHLSDTIMELDVTVGEVLKRAERHETGDFVGRHLPVSDACDQLTGSEPPVALLVTHSGKPSESLLGVLTVSDVPQMLRDITISMP